MKLLKILTIAFQGALIIALLFSSCTQKPKGETLDLTGYTKRTIKLINGLGSVSIYLPDELDTAFSFNYSDDGGDATQVFEFANKKYSIELDKDFVSKIKSNSACKKDSVYEFTIIQALYLSRADSVTTLKIDSFYMQGLKRRSTDLYGRHFHFKISLLKINSRDFAVIETRNKNRIYQGDWDTTKFLFQLSGATIVKNKWVFFDFTCLKKDTTGFINRMLKSMKTIEIDTKE